MPESGDADRESINEQNRRAGRRGGFRRAIVLSDKHLAEIGRKGANARWGGLTAEERKIERARGRAPKAPTEPASDDDSKAAAARA